MSSSAINSLGLAQDPYQAPSAQRNNPTQPTWISQQPGIIANNIMNWKGTGLGLSTFGNTSNADTGDSGSGGGSWGDGGTKPPTNNDNGTQTRITQLTQPGYNRNPAEDTELKNLIAQLEASQQDDSRLIDEAYNSSFDYLNKAEGALRADFPNFLQEAEGNFNVNSAQLKSQLDNANNQFGMQTDQATQRQREALSANRRLYSDLRTGYNQRFGGSTSAGQAASEIANVEQQRQMGKTNQTYAETARAIEVQKQNVQKEYDNGVLQLQQQKQSAINQANRDFQNKLLEIEKNRADINMNKAQARLGALQNLRNQIFQINVQNMQFQQQLQLQREAAQQELSNYQAKLGGATGAATSSFNSFLSDPSTTTNPQSDLQVQTGGNQAGSPMVGSIKRDENQGLFGQIGSGLKTSFDWLKGDGVPFIPGI